MNVALVVAGSLALLGAVIHGGAGEALVVRRLSPETLPSTRFGGAKMTKAMIRASWHLTTIGFVTVGCALVLAGSVLSGDVARGVAVVAAAASTGFAAVVLSVGGAARAPRSVLRHPAPVLVVTVTALAWWGVRLVR